MVSENITERLQELQVIGYKIAELLEDYSYIEQIGCLQVVKDSLVDEINERLGL